MSVHQLLGDFVVAAGIADTSAGGFTEPQLGNSLLEALKAMCDLFNITIESIS